MLNRHLFAKEAISIYGFGRITELIHANPERMAPASSDCFIVQYQFTDMSFNVCRSGTDPQQWLPCPGMTGNESSRQSSASPRRIHSGTAEFCLIKARKIIHGRYLSSPGILPMTSTALKMLSNSVVTEKRI